MRERQKDENERERERVREKGINTRWSKPESQRRISLFMLLLAPSQLLGFMESFLSWCCFLIDIKMH